MKFLILIILISATTLANDSFLTTQEIKKIEGYIDDVCPDTYCGGDLQYYPSNLNCSENSCKLDFLAKGYESSYNVSQLGILGKTFQSEENEDVYIKYLTHKSLPSNKMEMTFTCNFKNLTENADIYNDNTEMFYIITLDCISELEDTIFNYRY